VQYTLNTTPHVSLGGISPFEAERGYEPLQPWDVANPRRRLAVPPRPLPRSSEVSEEDVRRGLNQAVRQALTAAKQKQKVYADAKRRPAEKFRPDDWVLVSRAALMSHADRELARVTGVKLAPLYIGLYRVVKEMPNRCQLDLSRSMRAHDVVNVAHLRRFETAEGFGRTVESPPIFLEGEAVFRPQALKMHRRRRGGGKWQHS
jgi:hypothetical protein